MQTGSLLILGARSLIGGFLLPRLAARGEPVAALSRRAAPDGSPPGSVSWIEGDLTAPLTALPPLSAAIGLCPIWLLPDAAPALIAAGAKQVIAFSSTSRTTKARSASREERAVADRLDEGEARTATICAAAGVACTILRPTLIYAEGQDGNVSRLAAMARRFGVLPLSGEGKGLRQPVHADDLAVAALAALDRMPPEPAYNLPGGETLTYRQMAVRIFEGLGRRPRIVGLPPPIWRLGFTLASPFLRGASAQMGERMDVDLAFDPEPARRDLGWSPRDFHPRF